MNNHVGWKKTTAFIMALTLVAGNMPANVGGFFTVGTGIVATAVPPSENNSGILYDNASIINSWTSGDCTVTLDSEGTLTVSKDEGSGNGAMADYDSAADRPWNNNSSGITSVIIEDGVTTIGNTAFANFSSLNSVTIPGSVNYIGTYSFYKCSSLQLIVIPNSVNIIGNKAFSSCSNLTSVQFNSRTNDLQVNQYGFQNDTITSITPSNLQYVPINNPNATPVSLTAADLLSGNIIIKGVSIAYTPVEAKAPTYEENGNIAYYVGTDDKYYSYDETTSSYTEIDLEDTVISKLEMQPSMNIVVDSSKMDLNFYVPIADDYSISDYTVTYGGEDQTLSEIQLSNKNYGVFTVKCAAKNMTDEKQFVIKNGDTQIFSDNISAAGYLKQLKDHSTYGPMVKSMLRYGAAAQNYFGYKTDDPANSGIEGYGLDTLKELNIDDNSPTQVQYAQAFDLQYSSYYGMNMTYDYDTSLLIAFRITGSYEASKAELEEKFVSDTYEVTCEKDNTGNFIIVKVANIPIKKLGEPVFTFGGVYVKATDYLARIANNPEKSDKLRDLCRGLYAFYASAT